MNWEKCLLKADFLFSNKSCELVSWAFEQSSQCQSRSYPESTGSVSVWSVRYFVWPLKHLNCFSKAILTILFRYTNHVASTNYTSVLPSGRRYISKRSEHIFSSKFDSTHGKLISYWIIHFLFVFNEMQIVAWGT